ncbi:multisubstrate pseudouridine synthase 7 [Umbelopsis sp. WA50703]
MSDPTTPSTALDIPEAKRLRTSNEELEYVEDSALSEALKSQDSTVSIQTGSALSASAIDDTAKTADADKHITEEQVGILQYISPYLTGFTGIIKDRITDFLVNEVDKDGHVVHLESTDIPQTIKSEKEENNGSESNIPSDDELYSKMEELLESETVTKIKDMLNKPEDKKASVECPAQDDKQKRTETHLFFKTYFKNKLVTTTVDGKIVVRWWRPSDKKDKRALKDEFLALGGDYLQFSMYKENIDTMEAVNTLCKFCRLGPKSIGYAGTKDKRAITVQNVTAYHARAANIARAQEALNRKGIYIANFKYVKDPLSLGDLSGNRFGIVLRDVAGASQEAIEESLKSLKNKGFINYYGMQRFGTGSIPTHAVGRCVLNGDWKLAIDYILMPRSTDRSDWAKARRTWIDTHDAELALSFFPRQATLEISVLKQLKKNPTDFARAFGSIPRNMRLMYVHAYQSYVWNHAASERIRLYGADKVVVGDLVSLSNNLDIDEATQESEDTKPLVKHVTEEDLDKYTIFDVVLPQPGTKILYPNNEVLDVYKSIMKPDNIDPLNMNIPNQEYRLPGAYRALMAKPSQLDWSFIRYDDPNKKLCQTDADLLKGEAELTSDEGPYLALRLNLSLSTSQYATMALREIMKQQTSSGYHAGLKRTRNNAD